MRADQTDDPIPPTMEWHEGRVVYEPTLHDPPPAA